MTNPTGNSTFCFSSTLNKSPRLHSPRGTLKVLVYWVEESGKHGESVKMQINALPGEVDEIRGIIINEDAAEVIFQC